jgi:hypothetical protein
MKRILLTTLLVVSASAQQPYPPGQYPQYPPQQYPAQQYPAQQYPGTAQPGPLPGQYDGLGQPAQLGQPAGDYDDQGYAPEHGVARLSFMSGNVSVFHGDQGEPVAAVLNAPLTASDRVATSDGARAEIQFDSANVIRLGPASEIRLSDLEYGRAQVQIATGLTIFRVLRDGAGQVEISTPSVAVHPVRQGIYRVIVQPDGQTEITVRTGEAEVSSPRGSERVRAGQTMLVRGSPSDPEFQRLNAYPPDEFERWSDSRDVPYQSSISSQYVSPDVYGAQDLDQYGRWNYDPEYGNVWVPQVAADWAPYRCGRWSWIEFYGWSWVGCEPWGWAPYHYGNWYHGSFGWSWYPGSIRSHYYWRPALVGFFGWGGRGYGGFGYEHVGWVPLAPRERFHAWYGNGYRGNNFGIANNSNVFNSFRNARFNNGVTGIRSGDFGRVGISNGNFVRPGSGDLSRAGMVRGALPLQPSRESRRFSDRQASTQGLPRVNENTHFFSRQGPRQDARGGGSQRTFQQTQPQRGGFQQAPAQGGFRQAPAQGGFQQTPSRGGFQQAQPGFNSGGNNGNSGGGFRRFEGGNRGGFSNPAPQNQPTPQAPRAAPQVQQPAQPFNRGFDQGRDQGRGFNQPQPQRGFEPAPQQRGFGRPQQERRNFEPAQPRNFGSSGSVRINPPIVQQRNENRGGGGRSFEAPRQGGGGGRSFEAPRQGGGGGGAPGRSAEAPRGGGGGNRGGGGGGGGNRGGGGGGGNRGGGGGGHGHR